MVLDYYHTEWFPTKKTTKPLKVFGATTKKTTKSFWVDLQLCYHRQGVNSCQNVTSSENVYLGPFPKICILARSTPCCRLHHSHSSSHQEWTSCTSEIRSLKRLSQPSEKINVAFADPSGTYEKLNFSNTKFQKINLNRIKLDRTGFIISIFYYHLIS